MPTIKPRLNVTLEPHRYELLKRLAALRGVSMASIVSEFVETVAPVLERLVVVLEQVEHAQESALDGMRRSAHQAEAAIMPFAKRSMAQLDIFLEQVSALADDGSARTPPPSAPSVTVGAEGGGIDFPHTPQDPRPVITGVRSSSTPHPKKPGKPHPTRVLTESRRGGNT